MKNYLCFKKYILRDKDLTLEAKLILSYIVSIWYCTDGQEPEIETNYRLFENIFGLSQSFVKGAFSELKLKGLIKISKSKIGTYGEQLYFIELQNSILKRFPEMKSDLGIKHFI